MTVTLLSVFLLGAISGNLFTIAKSYGDDHPGAPITAEQTLASLAGINPERDSPFDHIKESDIQVFDDKVILNLDNPQWARFTDTNSMDPVLDAESNAIEIIPKSPEDINVGDIISYQTKKMSGTIIHRVIEIGEDDDGWYARTKGDNNPTADPSKIRFSDVKRMVVAIVY